MRQVIFFFLTIFGASLMGFGQENNGRISGRIIDGNAKTLEAATISLMRSSDSVVVKFAVANRSGDFVFETVPFGNYMVGVTAVGHQKGYSEAFELNTGKTSIELKTIELVPVSKSMAAIVVTGKKPLIEHRIDRTVVNVDASVTNVGSSALEVLEKSPGITVDKDGNISLKGKDGVMVLIDGRPTQLAGGDLANLLRNLNANQLDQVEIMTNPPAKYDAAGNAGIINIKTKKNRQVGYNGSVTLGYGQGVYPKFNEGFVFNYREGKMNLFTNLSHNYRKSFNNLDIQRNLRNRNTKELEQYFDQEARMMNTFNSFNGKLGADYFATKNTTFGIVFSGFSNPGTFRNANQTQISDASGSLESTTIASVENKQHWKNFSTNLNFRTILDSAGRELTADLDYITYNSTRDQKLVNAYFDGSGAPAGKADTLLADLPQEIAIYSGRIDYLHPLKKGARFEAGLKSSIVKTDNNAVYDSISYGQVVRDLNRSNYFIYEENINAAYVNLSTPLSAKLNAQLGLRVENTIAKGRQATTGQQFERNYTQLFPTVYFQYKANEKNNFGLNYGRRIRRPNYQSMNPFIEFLDRYTYQQGNPDLKPQFSHNIEASHTFRNFLTTTLNYSETNDIIQQVIQQKGQEAYVRQENIASARQIGISVSSNMPITKWWTNSLYVNVFNNRFSGIIDSTSVTVEATTLALNGSQQFKLSKTWSAEISGFYRTSGMEGVMEIGPMGMIAVGLSKQVFQGKGSLRLNVRDIFLMQRTKGSTVYANVDMSFTEARDSRVVNLGFTWRFSKGKMSNVKKRNGGSAGDEQNRVGVGG